MRNEIEIKLPADDAPRLKRRLKELGFRVARRRHFESNLFFDFADARLRNSGSLLRLRFVDGRCTLTFKEATEASKSYKIRLEIETAVEHGEELRQVLKRLGLKETFRYEKYRTIYRRLGADGVPEVWDLSLDETPIGTYVELEGPKRWINEVAGQLGFKRADYLTEGYVTMYFRQRKASDGASGSMVF